MIFDASKFEIGWLLLDQRSQFHAHLRIIRLRRNLLLWYKQSTIADHESQTDLFMCIARMMHRSMVQFECQITFATIKVTISPMAFDEFIYSSQILFTYLEIQQWQ